MFRRSLYTYNYINVIVYPKGLMGDDTLETYSDCSQGAPELVDHRRERLLLRTEADPRLEYYY